MTAIEASSVRVSTMADGTLRVVLDVEPRHAQDAFRLFGSPGTAVALAALVVGAQEPQPEKPKGGEIAKWLGIRCDEHDFHEWLQSAFPARWTHAAAVSGVKTAEGVAAQLVRLICGVKSRADIDHDDEAAERFHRLIRGPYSKYLVSIGVTT